jgi:phosphopantetheinyl transferase (holo-ACP synthase)
MELEYKLAAIIGSCVNEGQLFTARECILKAGNRLMHDEFAFLTHLADHKETALKAQMLEFRTNAAILAADLQCTTVSIPVVESCGLIALEDVSISAENVERVANTITLK